MSVQVPEPGFCASNGTFVERVAIHVPRSSLIFIGGIPLNASDYGAPVDGSRASRSRGERAVPNVPVCD